MDNKSVIIGAPLSGTWYARPSPEEPPYVEVGQKVKKGDVVCLVESMKVFIEVRTNWDGTVSKILVNNEDAVAIHQPLIELNLS